MAEGVDGERALGEAAIVKFFRTGVPPVEEEESLEIYTFMEAADESRRQGGASVTLATVRAAAEAEARERVERHLAGTRSPENR